MGFEGDDRGRYVALFERCDDLHVFVDGVGQLGAEAGALMHAPCHADVLLQAGMGGQHCPVLKRFDDVAVHLAVESDDLRLGLLERRRSLE